MYRFVKRIILYGLTKPLVEAALEAAPGIPKFVTENGQLRVDFPSQIWEIWTGLDMIRAGWLGGDFP